MPKYIFLFVLSIILNSCGLFRGYQKYPKTEFRGVWIATVVNIDWPKNGNDDEAKQKEDYLKLLNFYEQENYNAVIVQVRAAGDAFYNSDYAPWSRFLTGQEGKAPNWNTDVLEWMILETHKRGMEFHAWLNPYRATFDENFEVLSETHDYCAHPDWMVHYGKKNYYNPGLPQVQKHFTNIIEEVVTKYDVDAIHFDDYFYPYRIAGVDFKDSITFKAYAKENQNLADWRRSNIDSLISQTHRTIKSVKPWVQFGVSPFGVWKNKSTDTKGSATKAGQTTYDDLYADPLLWMEQGWIDYLAPQIYWSMDLQVASHSIIMDWWAKNTKNTNLYIGNGAYKIRNNSDEAWNNLKELPNQIKLARKTAEVSGNVMFSANSLMKDRVDIVDYIEKKYYPLPALTPTNSYQLTQVNTQPKLISADNQNEIITLTFNDLEQQRFVIFYDSGAKTRKEYPIKKMLKKQFIDSETIITVPKNISAKKNVAICFLDRYGRESKPMVIQLKKLKNL